MKSSTKDQARQYVWDTMQEERVARFPFPPYNRIPNFAGAREAAERLMNHQIFSDVRKIKVNPDAPQRYVRWFALEKGMTVYMPTPRLRAGFKKLDPGEIPQDEYKRAASLSHADEYASDVSLKDLPRMDLIVAGSVAVTPDGFRCGKGHGYSDLEYAVLRELGHPPTTVVTTVHPIQVVDSFPRAPHDVPLSVIVTPDDVIEVKESPDPPDGIDWALLTDDDLEAMPVLREINKMKEETDSG